MVVDEGHPRGEASGGSQDEEDANEEAEGKREQLCSSGDSQRDDTVWNLESGTTQHCLSLRVRRLLNS